MPKVELVYDADCPNVARARAQLRLALEQEGQAPEWEEWVSDNPSLPVYAHDHGSPTVLVNERDVAADGGVANSCRLYEQGDGTLRGVPPVDAIASALRIASPAPKPGSSDGGWSLNRVARASHRDLVASNARWVLWGVPLGLVAVGLFLTPGMRGWLWTPAFLLAGAACLFNARRCGRTHCYITGPIYLMAALLSVLRGVDVVGIGWMWLLVGAAAGTAVAYQIEWIRGRYVDQTSDPR